MMLIKCILVSVLVVFYTREVESHGMLMVPVNRGSAWRVGYKTPVNYDDNANFCGGFAVQWGSNKGKCGACGDSFSLRQPRPHENTGTYGTGTIVGTYHPGSTVHLTVKLTSNHKGHFVFSLCPLSSSTRVETEECFNKHPLKLTDGSSKYILKNTQPGVYNVAVVLPAKLTCKHCVLRWHYNTGNNWGICKNGTGAMGCGPQETFRTCSDISIIPNKRRAGK